MVDLSIRALRHGVVLVCELSSPAAVGQSRKGPLISDA
jgi:hypothetical protein